MLLLKRNQQRILYFISECWQAQAVETLKILRFKREVFNLEQNESIMDTYKLPVQYFENTVASGLEVFKIYKNYGQRENFKILGLFYSTFFLLFF